MLTEPTPTTETAPTVVPDQTSRPMPVPLVPGLELPPRQRPLPAEEQAARPAAAHRGARARTARQPHGPRRLRVGQPVVVGVRDRGDPARPHPGRRRRRVRARPADHDRAARRSRVLDPLVPADDQGLPDRRWRVHGHPRQLRAHARAGRRRRAPHRLRAHRLGVGRGGHRRSRVGVPDLRAVRIADLDRVRDHHRLRQPARRVASRASSSRHRRTSSSSTWRS